MTKKPENETFVNYKGEELTNVELYKLGDREEKFGYREEYYPDGQLKCRKKGSFDNRQGVWELFDKQGELVWFGVYPDPEGQIWHEPEAEFSEPAYYLGVRQWRGKLEIGKREGLWEYFDPKGRLEECGKYSQGVKEGLWEFWLDGQLVYKENYKNGITDPYFADEDLEEEFFLEFINHKYFKHYRPSLTYPKENQNYDINEKGEEIRYRFSASYKTVVDDGYSFIEMRDGPYEEYYMQNIFLEIYNKIKKHKSLKFRASYKKGVLNGLCEYFDEEGNLIKTETYKNGKLIEE